MYNKYMVDSMGTSFIPKKTSTDKVVKLKRNIDLVLLITIVIFLISTIFSLGLFLYKNFLESNIEESAIMLEKEKGAFDVDSIKVLSRLDKRIMSAEELLDKHIDPVGFFEFLEENTLKSIQFDGLNFSVSEEGVEVIMSGIARNYASVALQSDVFGSSVFIKNPIFSNLDVNKVGDVIFDFSALVDNDLVLYKNKIE